MKCICPNPGAWHEAFERLCKHAQLHSCTPSFPPKPLILTGWAYSNDVEKMQRWEETVIWAEKNSCSNIVSEIPENDFYFVEKPTNYKVGPMGDPMYRDWDSEAKSRPSSEQIAQFMDTLQSRWSEIVGDEIASITRPLAFTGDKARRLLVLADFSVTPPWGGWSCTSTQESERLTFTHFRATINKAIAPHEVDHIDFITEKNVEQKFVPPYKGFASLIVIGTNSCNMPLINAPCPCGSWKKYKKRCGK